MKKTPRHILLLRRAHLLNLLVMSIALFFLFSYSAKADALLGVIGYHIVPMQMESSKREVESDNHVTTSSAVSYEDSQLSDDNYQSVLYVDVPVVVERRDEM